MSQPQSWYAFSSGISGVLYSAAFARGNRVKAEIYIDQGDADRNPDPYLTGFTRRGRRWN